MCIRDRVYIDALVASMKKELAKLTFEPEVILVSFHGVPKEYLLKGDPYHCQCVKTWRLMREAFGWPEDKLRMSFQSRFGKAEWLQPYTDATLEKLGKAGTARVDVICPGFAADCLETLEEIAMEGKETFLHAGGKAFNYLPVCNDSEPFVHALAAVAEENLAGWVSRDWDRESAERANKTSAALAKTLGA